MNFFTLFPAHTERIEFIVYALFGLAIALLPYILQKLSTLHDFDLFITNVLKVESKKVSYLIFVSASLLSFHTFQKLFNSSLFFNYEVIIPGFLIGYLILIRYPNIKERYTIKFNLLIFLAFLIFSVLTCFSTSYINSLGKEMMVSGGFWHHWGAYISAPQSLKNGLAIYKDFPTQYGLGPSIFILCASQFLGWFTGVFFVISLFQILYWLSIFFIALILVKKFSVIHPLTFSFVLIVTFFTCFFWAPLPVSASNLPPSLGGLRYFPVSCFVAILFSFNLTSKDFSKIAVRKMHLLWMLSALWSVESAFYVSLVWWPYFFYLRSSDTKEKSDAYFFSMKIKELIKVSLFFVLGSLLIYFVYFHTFPDLNVYLVFLNNIPGPLLINFYGTFIFAAVTFFLGLYSLIFLYFSDERGNQFHYFFVLMLFSYASFSYYIGRSADINILPLIPIFCLLYLAMFFMTLPKAINYFAILTIIFIASWCIFYNFANTVSHRDLFKFDLLSLNEKFIKTYEGAGRFSDALRIVESDKESIVVIDSTGSVLISGAEKQWSSYNNFGTYAILPLDMQRKFISRSSRKLLLSGWVLVEKKLDKSANIYILDLFGRDYVLDEKIEFQNYHGYHFKPIK